MQKIFLGTPGEMDYSGFDREKWLKRSVMEHRQVASDISSCTTKSAIASKESESGYRYTELLKLSYFDPSRMLTIDPMHNLFLGSGKHIVKNVWMKFGLVTESQFDAIQNRIDRMICPPDIGRIPNKIHSGFASFTAEQELFSLLSSSLELILNVGDILLWLAGIFVLGKFLMIK